MKKMNKKSPLLLCVVTLLLCAALVTVIFSGNSLAKYISEKNHVGQSEVAALNCNVSYAQTTYNNISINRNSSAIYMVVDQFVLENTGEVAMSFELALQLSAVTGSEEYGSPVAISRASSAAPARGDGVAFRQIRMKNSTTAEIADVDFASVCTGQTYTAGKIYYAVSTDGTSYTWHTADALAMSGEMLPAGRVYYKVAYFIDLSTEDESFAMPRAALLYRVHCEQILK